MNNEKFLIVLCFEDSFSEVRTFDTAAARAAFGEGVVTGAMKYGAGNVGTYHWPNEQADMKAHLDTADHAAALKALAEEAAK